MYLMWAILPEETLHEWEITYYPDKAWALYIPTSLLCAFVAAPFLYAGLNILATPGVDSIDTVWDEYSRAPDQDANDLLFAVDQSRKNDKSTTTTICDVDVGVINRFLDDHQACN